MFGFVLLLALVVLVLSGQRGQASQTLGDTVITTPGNVWADDTIYMEGNLTVASGGELTISNVVLQFNMTGDGEHWLSVEGGSMFDVMGGTLITSSSSSRYDFWIEAASTWSIRDTIIEYAGYAGTGSMGISIKAMPGANVILDNVEIRYGGGNGIYWPSDSASLSLTDCWIHDNAGDGILFPGPNSGNSALTVDISDIDHNGRAGVYVEGMNGATFTVRIVGTNIMNNPDDGAITFDHVANSTVNVFLDRATLMYNMHGVYLVYGSYIDLTVNAANSTVSFNDNRGLSTWGTDHANIAYIVTDSTLEANFFSLSDYYHDGGNISMTVTRSTIVSAIGDCLMVGDIQGGRVNLVVRDSTISGCGGHGIVTYITYDADVSVHLSSTIVASNSYGVADYSLYGGNYTLTVDQGSSISGNINEGVIIDDLTAGNLTVVLDDSNFNDNGNHGISILPDGYAYLVNDPQISLDNVLILRNGGYGFYMGDYAANLDLAPVFHDVILNSNYGGIYFIGKEGGSFTFKPTGTFIIADTYGWSSEYGLYIGSMYGADLSVDLTMAQIMNQSSDGIHIEGSSIIMPLEDWLPGSRMGTSAVFTGQYYYVFGGTTCIGNCDIAEIVKFDPVTHNSWTIGTVLPSPRMFTSAVWDGGEFVYIFGGEQAWHGTYLNQILRFNVTDESISILPVTMPFSIMGTSAIWDGQYAYIFGGFNGNPRSEIFRFDPVAGTVTVVGYLPDSGGYWTAAAWDGTHAYIFGGYDNCWNYCTLSSIVRFDPVTGIAETVGYMPLQLQGASAVWSGNRVIILGGDYSNFGSWFVTTDTIYAYDPATNTIEAQPPLPEPRSYGSAAADGAGMIALFGGAWTTPYNSVYSEIFMLDSSLISAHIQMDISIQASTVEHNGGSAVYVDTVGAADIAITIAGSQVGGSSNGLNVHAVYQSQVTISLTGNNMTESSNSGVYLEDFVDSDSVVDIMGNDMTGSTYGFDLYDFRNSATTTRIENNTFDSTSYALYLEYPADFDDPVGARPSYFYIFNNVAYNVYYGFIYYDSNYYAPLYIYIDNLVVTGDPYNYWSIIFFDIEYTTYADLHVWINDVTATNGQYGLYYYYQEYGDTYITIQDSVFTNVYYGIYLEYAAFYSDLFRLEILNTEFYISEYGYGIYIDYMCDDYGSRYEMTIVGSLFDDYSGDDYWYEYGIYVDYADYGVGSWTIIDTDFVNYYDYGWYLEEMEYGASATVWMYDGSFVGAPGEYAVSIYLYQDWYDGAWDINLVSVEGDQAYYISDSDDNGYTSYITLYWYIDVTVYTGLNLDLPAPNVNVLVHDNGGRIVAGGMTDSSGMVTGLIAKEYRMAYGFLETYTPHSVVASNGMMTASTTVSISGADQSVVLHLAGDADGDGFNDVIDPDDDNDGYSDNVDAFPDDPAEWRDSDGDGTGDNTDSDDDNDGYLDTVDEFPYNPNEWNDTDNDGVGDNSDPDIDGDGYLNDNDAFPWDPTEWRDTDNDGTGDNTDPDIDGDGVDNAMDAFPYDPSEWTDTDGDGVGDNKDWDIDGDDVANGNDIFPYDPTEWRDTDNDGIGDNSDPDIDGDGVDNAQDAFPYDSREWTDTDGDGIGDNSDPDIDGDGYLNHNDAFPYNPTEWRDTDGDGIGDNSDPDDDGDGRLDTVDAFPKNPNEWADTDGDGIGDNSDPDIDNDGYLNANDAFPYDANEWRDTDNDGTGDNSDPDIDGDGVNNAQDDFPYDPNEWSDLDNDGVGDNKDWDIDGDGISNDQDGFPRNPNESRDTDGDGIGDNADTDDDGDGVLDTADAFPMNPNEWADMDGDGVGDNSDPDIDGDDHLNANDAFPNDDSEWRDTDNDGIGDNVDTDKDGDGVLNAQDDFPMDPSEWSDMDGDGVGDNSDIDIDGDGTLNVVDEDPYDATKSGTIFPQGSQTTSAAPDYTMLIVVIAVLMIVLLLVSVLAMFRKGKPAAVEMKEEEPEKIKSEEKKETEKKEESEEL